MQRGSAITLVPFSFFDFLSRFLKCFFWPCRPSSSSSKSSRLESSRPAAAMACLQVVHSVHVVHVLQVVQGDGFRHCRSTLVTQDFLVTVVHSRSVVVEQISTNLQALFHFWKYWAIVKRRKMKKKSPYKILTVSQNGTGSVVHLSSMAMVHFWVWIKTKQNESFTYEMIQKLMQF